MIVRIEARCIFINQIKFDLRLHFSRWIISPRLLVLMQSKKKCVWGGDLTQLCVLNKYIYIPNYPSVQLQGKSIFYHRSIKGHIHVY